jgi:hypothetical protein
MALSLPLPQTAPIDANNAAELLLRLKQLQSQLAGLLDDFTRWASPMQRPAPARHPEVSLPQLPAHPSAQDRKRHVDALLDRYGQCGCQPHRSVREKDQNPYRT